MKWAWKWVRRTDMAEWNGQEKRWNGHVNEEIDMEGERRLID